MRVLFILPHCSTGGMPQYVYKLIQTYSAQNSINVIEVNNYSDQYTVQRNKIKDICPIHQLNGNQENIFDVIRKTDPEVIHFQEIPETFLEDQILKRIYSADRNYKILVTTHSSYTDPAKIKYTADRYILVSEWSRKVFENHYQGKVECKVWEYPVVETSLNKEEFKKWLKFDLNKKHILNVGLFTRGKNQHAIVDLARLCLKDDLVFHFVGNQAANFQDYWLPIMSSFPENCIWHGEVSNVEDYYVASDLFYFPSLFELNPICLKEAESFGLPLFINNLHTYDGAYDGKATYITEDQNINRSLILRYFDEKK